MRFQVCRTYWQMAANLYWRGMKRTVQEYVPSCETGQRQKYLVTCPGELLQPLPVPERVWDDISLDSSQG